MANENLDQQLSKLRIDKAHKTPRRGNGRWPWILLVLVIAGGAAAVYGRMNTPLQVKTVPIEQEGGSSSKGAPMVTASGYVVPRHKVEVSSKVVGRVKEVRIKRGDLVKEGDVLLTLEDEEYRARIRSAEAQVAVLRARLAELRTGSRPQEIAAANAAVVAAKATCENAASETRRMAALEEKGAVSKQEADRARAALDVAKARLDADRKNAELVKIGPRQEQIDGAEAQLREAEANLDFAKTELSYTVIQAPISGTILEKLAEQGELVTNTNFGGTRGAKSSVVSMADLGDLQVEVDVNETELSKVKLGQKTELRLDANPDAVYAGEVDEISPQADRQKGSVQVKVRFDRPDSAVMAELNARVTFLDVAPKIEAGASARPRLWIPTPAIVRTDGATRVYVLSDNKAVARNVTLGAESEKGVEVKDGLSGTETLIVSPLEKLTDGARVAPAQ